MVPFPELEGPSMVTMGTAGFASLMREERLSSFPRAEETIVLFDGAQGDAQVLGQLVVAHRAHDDTLAKQRLVARPRVRTGMQQQEIASGRNHARAPLRESPAHAGPLGDGDIYRRRHVRGIV